MKSTKLNKKSEIDEKLNDIGSKYQLQELKLVIDKDNEEGKDLVHVYGKVNPEKDGEKIEKDLEEGTALKATDIPVKVNDLIKAKYINGRFLADITKIHEPEEKNKEDFVEHKYRYKKLNGEKAVKNTFKLFLDKWKNGDIEKVNEERKYLIENRPSHKSDFRDKVWANAPKFVDENGNQYAQDANNDYIKIYKNDNWDAGHKTGSEYRYLVDDYINGNISWDDSLEEYHDENNYQVEDRYQNRSHKHELKK
ncbi:HNH/ENDO VII family nuclease [Chryseobacterium sp.]|uniref:HNH/ENDO VII family nuclease n=1 Tax=Chryseobacterium sp. TaxID=1871047 RepID=UPI003219B762